jgi:hypothetical protein
MKQGRVQLIGQIAAESIRKTRSPGVDPNTLTQPDSVPKKAPKPDLETVINRKGKPGYATISAPTFNKKTACCIAHKMHCIDSIHFCQSQGEAPGRGANHTA